MKTEIQSPIPVFFIVGRARSGTTLLRSMLDNHPSVIVPPECAFVNNMYSRYHSRKNWQPGELERFYNDLISQPSFDYLNADVLKLKKDILSSLPSSTYADLCRSVYLNYKPVTLKKEILLIGDKNPHYSLFIPRLNGVFPEARFIHIIRDPRDNVLSMMGVDFESHIVTSLAWRWKYYNQLIGKQKLRFPDKFYTLKYEDIVSAPEKYTREICSFLGLEYDPVMFDFYKNKEEVLKQYPPEAVRRYHKSLFEPVNISRNGLWKEKLTEKQIKSIETITRQFAENYGYFGFTSRDGFLGKLRVFPGVFYGWLYMVWGNLLNLFPYGMRMRIIFFMARIFKPWWKRY